LEYAIKRRPSFVLCIAIEDGFPDPEVLVVIGLVIPLATIGSERDWPGFEVDTSVVMLELSKSS
jgi:hypothetical protein